MNSTVFAGYGVGIAGAGVVCFALMRARAGSAQAWLGLGALALALTVVIWPAFDAERGRPGRSRRVSDRELRWDADAARLVVCYGAFGFGYIIPATFLPVMARQAIADPAIFGLSWPFFGAAAAASTFAVAGLSGLLGNRGLWSVSHVVMAAGVVLPVFYPGIVPILVSALLVGSTFTVTTMAGFQEGRLVGGKRLIGALASAFAVGQILALVGVSYLVRADGGLAAALLVAGLLLGVSAWALHARLPTAPLSTA